MSLSLIYQPTYLPIYLSVFLSISLMEFWGQKNYKHKMVHSGNLGRP